MRSRYPHHIEPSIQKLDTISMEQQTKKRFASLPKLKLGVSRSPYLMIEARDKAIKEIKQLEEYEMEQ